MIKKLLLLTTFLCNSILSFGQTLGQSNTVLATQNRQQLLPPPVTATHLDFDGVNDFVEVGNIMPSTYTKEAWVYATSYSGSHNVISGGNTGQHAFWIPNGFLSAGHNGQWQNVSASTQLSLNTWYHIAVTYDAATTTMILYKNGVLVSSNSAVVPFNGGNALRIGAYDFGGNLFRGSIDEVRIWNRALSLAEIQNNMNCELVTPTTQTGLVAYYQFNQGFDAIDNTSITSLTDASANGNNGTLNNFTLTSATSNWLAGSAITTGNTCTVFLSTSNFNISSNFKIYPNPTTNNVTIDLISIDNSSVEVYDINGRKLFTQKLNNNSNNVNIDNLAAGVYMFKVTSAQGSATSKVIKQ